VLLVATGKKPSQGGGKKLSRSVKTRKGGPAREYALKGPTAPRNCQQSRRGAVRQPQRNTENAAYPKESNLPFFEETNKIEGNGHTRRTNIGENEEATHIEGAGGGENGKISQAPGRNKSKKNNLQIRGEKRKKEGKKYGKRRLEKSRRRKI